MSNADDLEPVAPIACRICQREAAWEPHCRWWRCPLGHTTSEMWAAHHRLGPFAPPPRPEPIPGPRTSVRYGQTTGIEVVRPDLFP